MRTRQKTREPTPGMPLGGEQEVRFSLPYFIFLTFFHLTQNGNTGATKPYGLRESTLTQTARSTEQALPRSNNGANPTQNRPPEDPKILRHMVKETAQQLQDKDGETSAPMPSVSKSKSGNARSSDHSVTAGSKCLSPLTRPVTHHKKAVGLGNPSTRADVESVRTASGGIKRNREGASDIDDTSP